VSLSILSVVRRPLGDERGLALPYALGVTMILSALAAGIFSYSTMNQGAAKRQQADQRAYGLAETGLSYALSTLQNAGPTYTSVPALSGSGTTVSLTGGSTRYWGSLSGNVWTLNSIGTVFNPSGPNAADVVRNVSLQAQITTTTTGDTRPYDYFMVDQPSGCFTLQNTVTFEIAIYVRGNLCLENNTHLYGPAVHVLGDVYVNSPQASVGTSSTPVPDFSITGNCYRNGALTACNASSTSQVWAGTYATTPPVVAKPAVDLAGTYANADLGPQDPCTTLTGSGFPGFDNDTAMNASKGDVVLTPTTAYDCQKVVAGATVAQIKWEPGSNPSQWGTLTVKGTIFFDGNLSWGNLTKIQYDGRATIYASGTLVMENQTQLCGVSACDASWVPSQDFLFLVVGSITVSGTAPISGDIGQQGTFQGGLYLVNDYDQDNNTTIWGPVIARNAQISNSGLFKPLPGALGGLPPGVPMDTTTVTSIETVAGSYAG
jgi:Tfp pilus assembly protein PilX